MTLRRRDVLVGGALAAGGLATLAVRPGAPATAERIDISALLPARAGDWTMLPAGEVVLPPDALSERIYESIVARRFVAPGAPPITLVAAYSAVQSYTSQLHRPEICYPSSGYAVGSLRPAPIALRGGALPATMLEARRRTYAEAILYWLRIGDAYPGGLWDQRLTIARGALAGRRSEGVIVRLSRPAEGKGDDRAALSRFAQALWDGLDAPARRLFFGPLIASPPGV